MVIDEFYFHTQRGLQAWERWGHPLDTLSVLVVTLWIRFSFFSPANLIIGGALALFSTLLVTKDELVHQGLCSRGEMWLHSILFILHPLVFLSLFAGWAVRDLGIGWLEPWWASSGFILNWFWVPVFFMLVHQIIYWNVWKKYQQNQ